MKRDTGFACSPGLRAIVFALSAELCMVSTHCQRADKKSDGSDAGAASALASVAQYVGRTQCITCHTKEADLWTGSHHDRAMQEAADSTVLGDFGNASFTAYGVTSRFSRRDGRFFVTTDGPDGRMREYQIRYTFGFTPLQQYLVEFPGGRLQTLPLCWNSRPKSQGGQRWFHISPDEPIRFNDERHWTGWMQNWNSMCADCHSTNLQKNYEVDSTCFRTTWSEIDVSCEACHGPGSQHVAWGNKVKAGWKPEAGDGMGLPLSLKDRAGGTWAFDPGARTAHRTVPARSMIQVETCAQCHSRRSRIDPRYIHGGEYMDTFVPQLLDEGMYYADGQILAAVNVYGSFLQSTMYRKGVVCSDCHNPHSLTINLPGNAVCYRCHRSEVYGTYGHHFHKPDSAGASCAGCHMPTTASLVVDVCLDHSIRVPRPDFTGRYSIPNACNRCHTTKSAQWAADSVARWYGRKDSKAVHYGEFLQAGRIRAPGAAIALVALADDRGKPAIVRATALSLLSPYADQTSLGGLQRGVLDKEPIVRYGAVKGLEGLPPDRRFAVGKHLLDDPVRGVRLEAVRVLCAVPSRSITDTENRLLDGRITEYERSLWLNGDQPFSWILAGNVSLSRGRIAEAESTYRKAVELYPRFEAGYVKLADLLRSMNRDDEGERVLWKAMGVDGDFADVHHALGLLMVRQGRKRDALAHFQEALRLRPQEVRYAYEYAMTLHDVGETSRALRLLENVLREEPYNRDVLMALVECYKQKGSMAAALRHSETLLTLQPDDPSLLRLYRELGGAL